MYDPAPRSPAPILFEVESESESETESESDATSQTWRGGSRRDDTTPLSGEKQAATALVGPADMPELTPELATRRSAATNYGDLAAIIRLQSTEIERLALENDRLDERLDDAHQRHDAEQDLRQDLEQQVLRLNARPEAPAPVIDVEEMRRAAREGMSAEIKPVLMAILDLLETTLPRNAVEPPEKPAETLAETPSPACHDTPFAEDFLRLPDILTRPLEELTARALEPASKPLRAIEQHPADAPRTTPVQHASPPLAAHRAALPGMFAWTSLFS